MLKKLLIRGGITLLGTAAILGWWTIQSGGSSVKSSDRIPAKVGDGGNNLEISVECTSPATMRVDFEDLSKPLGSQMTLQSSEKMPVGRHSWSIDVASGLGGYIELEAENPKVGDGLKMQVKMNGDEVDRQSETLNQPLEGGTAFFDQD